MTSHDSTHASTPARTAAENFEQLLVNNRQYAEHEHIGYEPIAPRFFQEMFMLRLVAEADGDIPGTGWNFIVLHHTDCGITRLHPHPDLVAEYLGTDADHLDEYHPDDPRQAVRDDIDILRDNAFFPSEFNVAGLVYDVHTGNLETVQALAPLRPDPNL